ncbi:Bax inhibitor-1/YccA family protein [Alishewanella sp. 16-MA]|uniref:Bax inhibitor-1/YccA family protein n=1 Tax=Alishewanella maricola TaxID=2795740 RepID=A0ABS8C502_9ALTE|nr:MULTISPECIES: Bax inhibitor-1/YccA family protein [Alishewanella]MDP4944544.1 Bax inhibitor-1/YccA family protein [Alishewanella sp.]MCB5227397.1 Bax inhibitor-1/YccA family protein [Alishewanella maricola]MDP5034892.1 Bax inhibitor-1/YccA family protein [Alishewanella sp.]MDP5187806.1 Bax inhibitor-1/YccA family protein [Alishewanella sp.]MDP5457918.1 Bax inhibitor-1/YccA family protein [Alishewanella sp. SMS8]
MSYRETSNINTLSHGVEINKVLRNTYFLLGLTLAFSAVTAVTAMAMNISPMASLVCMIAGFIMLFVVNKKADSASGIFWVFGFAGAMGASLGPMLSMYAGLANGPALIMQALAGTALIFFSLSAYVLTTRKDFSFMGGFLMIGLIVVLVAALANIFLAIPALSLTISAVVILIMSGLILFDTSRIINGGETNYIRATVSLYLNVFNIFVHLLSLLGIMGGDD